MNLRFLSFLGWFTATRALPTFGKSLSNSKTHIMKATEPTLSEKEALHIAAVLKRLLLKANKIYGTKYYRYSIQVEAGEVYVVGHEEIPYGADWEQKLCNVAELLNGL